MANSNALILWKERNGAGWRNFGKSLPRVDGNCTTAIAIDSEESSHTTIKRKESMEYFAAIEFESGFIDERGELFVAAAENAFR